MGGVWVRVSGYEREDGHGMLLLWSVKWRLPSWTRNQTGYSRLNGFWL